MLVLVMVVLLLHLRNARLPAAMLLHVADNCVSCGVSFTASAPGDQEALLAPLLQPGCHPRAAHKYHLPAVLTPSVLQDPLEALLAQDQTPCLSSNSIAAAGRNACRPRHRLWGTVVCVRVGGCFTQQLTCCGCWLLQGHLLHGPTRRAQSWLQQLVKCLMTLAGEYRSGCSGAVTACLNSSTNGRSCFVFEVHMAASSNPLFHVQGHMPLP